ncbi:hypothetical protein AUM41_09510 [Cronobacter malonaticus]|uniref:hypothetical protein n=1 Tax=Cronobacter malonaticus TaxID=413503 RepID=UPI0009B83FF9|nr:hypothetical protein [Cronobacter malonaticus]EGT4420086.1 hypothetical protein [Cronobacter malonaticus]EGT4445094.1 hypothetical protein [Cronobacter malonaticus]EGT4454493.1 hypothetical protein [Cronobacter malonaticus]
MLVVLFHFRHYLNDVYPLKDLGDRLFLFGEAGVDIFFVISGFIIVYSSRNREKIHFQNLQSKDSSGFILCILLCFQYTFYHIMMRLLIILMLLKATFLYQ